MGTLMQMLLDALRANAEQGNDGTLGGQEQEEMSRFILENVQVATMPHAEYEEPGEVNPLVQFAQIKQEARGGRKPPNMSKIMDHLSRLEEKVKVLELNAPPEKYKQKIWLAPGLSNPRDDGNAEDEPSDEENCKLEPDGKKGAQSLSPPGERRVPAAAPIRLEKEERSCFARFLFSRCWTAKDSGGRWKVKRNCPTHGSLSCPCGNIGPCKNIKKNPCPVDKLTCTKPKKNKKKKSGAMPVSKGTTFAQKPGRGTRGKVRSPSKVSRKMSNEKPTSTDGKPLIKKLLPCCFKDHVHTECCCRCKDNPKLSIPKKSEKPEKKSYQSKAASKKSEAAASKQSKGYDSDHPSAEGTSESEAEDVNDDDDPNRVQAFNVASVIDFLKMNRDYVGPARKRAVHSGIQSNKRKFGNVKNRAMKESTSRKDPENSTAPSAPVQSTTSFQITLHPVISEGELPEPEVVKHQILKTLSTMHGPMKVEQKIVVQGTKNSVVIVTHGEACQCNLCHMLKGEFNHDGLADGSPQVVKISTNDGCDTLINHSDGCRCDLCSVLDTAMRNNPGKKTPTPENETFIVAACSSGMLKPHETVEESSPVGTSPNTRTTDKQDRTEVDGRVNDESRTAKIHSLWRKSMCKANNVSRKVKRCRCSKCRQRRRVERMKLRLKKDMGSEGYEKILQEITRRRDENYRQPFKDIKPSDLSVPDVEDYEAPKKTKKSVSFSNELDSQYNPDVERHQLNHDEFVSERKQKYLPRDELDINDHDINATSKRKSKVESALRNSDSTVYSVNATSEESDNLGYGCGITIQDGIDPRRVSLFGRGHVSEEQKCFPPKHMPDTIRTKRGNAKQTLKKELSALDMEGGECASHRESSGKSRQDGDLHDGMKSEQSTVLLQDGAFPSKFVSWSPGSRSNVATVHSSESYYVPDEDEFPIVNVECDESVPSSGRTTTDTVQKVQIPVWFRMLPDGSPR